jgi:hypothetical protein
MKTSKQTERQSDKQKAFAIEGTADVYPSNEVEFAERRINKTMPLDCLINICISYLTTECKQSQIREKQ